MRIALVLLVVTAAFSAKAKALSKVDGITLLHECQVSIRISDGDTRVTADEVVSSTHCIGYVEGVIDANAFWDAVDRRDNHSTRPHYCMGESVTFEQVIRILVKYLEENPKELSEVGYICIQGALLKNFPCKA